MAILAHTVPSTPSLYDGARCIVAACDDGVSRIVDLHAGVVTSALPLLPRPESSVTPHVFAIHANASGMFVMGGNHGRIAVYDAADATAPTLRWAGCISHTGADVMCLRIIPQRATDAPRGLFVLCGLSTGVGGILFISTDGSDVQTVAVFTGAPAGDAIRACDVVWREAADDCPSALCVALGCNDGNVRLYDVPLDVVDAINESVAASE